MQLFVQYLTYPRAECGYFSGPHPTVSPSFDQSEATSSTRVFSYYTVFEIQNMVQVC